MSIESATPSFQDFSAEQSANSVPSPEYPQFHYTVPDAVTKYFNSLCTLGVIDPLMARHAVEEEWGRFLETGDMMKSLVISEFVEYICQDPTVSVCLARCYSYDQHDFEGESIAEALKDPSYDIEIRKGVLTAAHRRVAELRTKSDHHDLDPHESFEAAPIHSELAVLHNLILEIKEQKKK